MGRLLEAQAEKQGMSVVAKISRLSTKDSLSAADVCIDFSHASCVKKHALLAAKQGKNLVIGTTGWENQQTDIKKIAADYQTAILYAPNFSLGVYLFNQLLKEAARLLCPQPSYIVSCEEIHHVHKVDAPSGTAKLLSATLAEFYAPQATKEFSSLRKGEVVGTHTISFNSAVDSINLTHTAHNREGFALGALQAACWIMGKQGFYTLTDMMDALYPTNGKIYA